MSKVIYFDANVHTDLPVKDLMVDGSVVHRHVTRRYIAPSNGRNAAICLVELSCPDRKIGMFWLSDLGWTIYAERLYRDIGRDIPMNEETYSEAVTLCLYTGVVAPGWTSPMLLPRSGYYRALMDAFDHSSSAPRTVSHFPHACPACGSPAYIGFSSVECSRGWQCGPTLRRMKR